MTRKKKTLLSCVAVRLKSIFFLFFFLLRRSVVICNFWSLHSFTGAGGGGTGVDGGGDVDCR